ncbi:MAG TPA: BON domain-containing protein, partial [Gammaproteobacteria bacterium]|nr:BON domain-containing protein [Gammaproteobacteria bacterium]
MKKLLTILALILSLQSCIFVAGAAAGAAAIAVVYDHRKLEKILQDQTIADTVSDKIKAVPDLKNSHISVTCFNQIVLLTGETTTDALRQEAEDVTREVPDVKRVYN